MDESRPTLHISFGYMDESHPTLHILLGRIFIEVRWRLIILTAFCLMW
jgi:hypothetical protein